MNYSFYIRHMGGIAFCVFALLAFLIGYKEEIPEYKLFMHCFIAFAYWAVFYLCTRMRDERTVACLIFVYSLLLSVALRYLFWDYTGDPYEKTISLDTRGYEAWAIRGIGKSTGDFVNYLMTTGAYNLDDMGFFTYMQFFHDFFRDVDFVRNFLVLVNACLVTGAAIMVGRMGRYLNLDDYESMIVMAFYGLFPFWVVSTAMGLKENLFCFIIVAALYNIHRFREYRLTYNLVLAVLFIAWTYLFRFAIALMLIIVLVLAVISTEGNRKKLLIWMAVGAVVMALALNVVMMSFSGVSMDHVTAVTEDRMMRAGGTGVYGWSAMGLAAFVGPFPNFVRTGDYAIYYAAGLMTKTFCAVFVLFAIYTVVRRTKWRLYPIVAYMVMGYIMLLAAGVSLDMRYHITFFPAFCLLMGYGMSRCDIRKSVLAVFCLLTSAVTLMYNLR